MPRLVDTTIRLLSQEPLAGKVPTGELLRIAEGRRLAPASPCSRSPGAASSTPPSAAASKSPWERIRALKTRTTTPLGLALRGRFLVGARPVGADFVRRFVASAAESGIDVFRLHDPLNDVSNLREPGRRSSPRARSSTPASSTAPATRAMDKLVEQARQLPEIEATRALVHDPSSRARAAPGGRLVGRVKEASGLPVGFYCQGAGGTALADSLEAARAGADLIACAVYPLALSLHRVAGESLASALAGMGMDTGIDVGKLWDASDLVDEHVGDEIMTPHTRRGSRCAPRSTTSRPASSPPSTRLRAHAADDRLLETLEELRQIRRETGWPPLAAPIEQILASQALIHVLSARRYQDRRRRVPLPRPGRLRQPPGSVDATVARAVELLSDGIGPLDNDPPTAEDVRLEAKGLAAARTRPDRALRRGGRGAAAHDRGTPQPRRPR